MLLKDPRGDLGRFCIFGPFQRPQHFGDSTKESNSWNKKNGASKDATSKEMVFLTSTCCYQVKTDNALLRKKGIVKLSWKNVYP